MRRAAGMVVALATVAALVGCTHVVEDETEQLKDQLLAFDIVENGYATSTDDTLFDDAFSSIQLEVAFDATAEQLDELLTYWRFGVDGIDAHWSFGLTKAGDEQYDHFDSFDVSGTRSVADLTTMVRFWHGLGATTQSAHVGVNDFDSTGESDGSVQLQLGKQPLADIRDVMVALQQQALELPGRFQWIVDADIPAGTVSLAGANVLPDEHMLGLLEAIAAPPTAGRVGDVFFWAIESDDPFQSGNPLRLTIGVYLEPPSIADSGVSNQDEWDELGDRVLADSEVWPVIQEIADRLPRDERSVKLEFSVHGEQLAHLDPLDCTRESSEQVYGPLTFDLWQSWSGADCGAATRPA